MNTVEVCSAAGEPCTSFKSRSSPVTVVHVDTMQAAQLRLTLDAENQLVVLAHGRVLYDAIVEPGQKVFHLPDLLNPKRKAPSSTLASALNRLVRRVPKIRIGRVTEQTQIREFQIQLKPAGAPPDASSETSFELLGAAEFREAYSRDFQGLPDYAQPYGLTVDWPEPRRCWSCSQTIDEQAATCSNCGAQQKHDADQEMHQTAAE